MDPRFWEDCFTFLDLSELHEDEAVRVKQVLFPPNNPVSLELPWTTEDLPSQEWLEDEFNKEPQHVPNGPLEAPCNVNISPPLVPPAQIMPSVAQHLPAVTMYSQPPPAYTIPPPSTGYQQNVFVNNVTGSMSMHGYVTGMTGHYVPQHFTQMSEPPHDMTSGGRGQRTRSRGRGKRPEGVVDVPAPGYNQFVPIPTYHTGYYSPQVGPHPSAQHATGSPLYITPMYPPMYSAYAHGAQYYPPQATHVGPMMEDSVPQDISSEMANLTIEQPPPPQQHHHHHRHQTVPMYPPQHLPENEVFEAPPQTVIVNKNKDDNQEYIADNNNTTNNNIGHVIAEPEPVVEQHPIVTPNIIEKQQPLQLVNDRVNIAKLKTEPDPLTPINNNTTTTNTLNVVEPPKVAKNIVRIFTPEFVFMETRKEAEVPTVKQSVSETANNICTPVKEEKLDQQEIKPSPPNNKQVVEKHEEISDNIEQKISEPAVAVKSWGGNSGKSWASLFISDANQQQPAVTNFIINESVGKQPTFNNTGGKSFFNKINEEKLEKKFPSLHGSNEAFPPPQRNSNNINNNNRIGEFLSTYNLEFRTVSLLPRGLTNRSNYCYINSILQALLACPPFYNLLAALPHQRNRRKNSSKSPIPIIDSMVDFVQEFTPLSAEARLNRKEKGQRKDNIDILCGVSFEPAQVYKILNGIRSDTFVVEGRQEDAEEFFGCLLNALNDEMLELTKQFDEQKSHPTLSNGDIAATNGEAHDPEDVEWTVMGPKNKGSITRRADFGRTPISDIFRGQLRSRVSRMGDQITDNVQPFFTLQLDIEKPNSVYEALEQLTNKDKLEGVTCWKTNKQVEAWQQVTIEELPIVLVLHLKCFNFKLDGSSKIIKALEFPIDLKIDPKLLSSKNKYTAKQKQYKLFAVVYHDGKEITKGHYLTDAYHVGYGGWVRYDDSSVKVVQEQQVLHPTAARVPYLLYYRRSDTIGNQILKKD